MKNMNKARIDSVSPEGEPTISVIMSVYKEPIEWLRLSIKSILKQTFTDFEFIIICDNPLYTEGISILKEYAMSDRRIILIFNETNIGLTKSLNKGLVISKGKYIARMDADDISLPVRFERQYDYMESHPYVIVLGTNIKYIGKGAWHKFNDFFSLTNEAIRAQMLFDNALVHPSVFIRKSVLDKNKIKYDESYRHSQDYRLWEQLMEYGEFANLPDKLLNYRISPNQITSSRTDSQSISADIIRSRLQKSWLEKKGYKYPLDIIVADPYKVLCDIMPDKKISSTLEYKSFAQYVYLNCEIKHKLIKVYVSGDYAVFTRFNLLRLVIKSLL